MEMPKRPSQHQIEDISITEFKRLLPRQWVYREKEKDYGIDGEVEIFNKDGYATGLIFYVQLKSTDSIIPNIQTRIQLKKETFNYYRTLTIPTLIVKYVDDKKSIYTKWAHSINRFKEKKSAKSFSFHLEEKNLWNNELPNQLIKDLKKFMILQKRNDLLPINTYLNFDFDNLSNIKQHILKSKLREFLNEKENILKLVSNKEDSLLSINITNDNMNIDICDIIEGCYLPSLKDYECSYDELISNIFLALTIALLHFDKKYNALVVFESLVKEKMTTINNPETILIIIQEYALQGKSKKVIELWESIPLELKDNILNIKYQTILSLLTKKPESREMYEHYTLNKISELNELNEKEQLGVSYYNYAKFLRENHTRKSLVKSFSYYNKALKNNSFYYKEDFIFKEIGRVLFDLKKFNMSSICYKKGLELKEELHILVLYADALMFRGNYIKAQEIFLDYFQKKEAIKEDIDAEWYLKEAILKVIINSYEVKEQKRNYKKAITSDIFKNSKIDEIIDKDYEYIVENIDALNSFCHYNLAIKAAINLNHKEATVGFLVAALVDRNDKEKWMNTLTAAINDKNYDLTPLIITCAYNICGESFLEILYPFFEENSSNQNSTENKNVVNLIEKIVERENQKKSNQELPNFSIFTGKGFHNIDFSKKADE